MRSLTIFLAVLCLALSAAAQPPDTLWTKTFGGNNPDAGYSVQQTLDGGYIIAGYTTSFGPADYNVYLVKTDNGSNLTWQNAFGTDGWDFGYCVQQTSDGGYIIAGSTDWYGAGGYDVYLIKTDAGGSPLWENTYGGPYDDCGYSVQQTLDGGYIIAGDRSFNSAGDGEVYLIKTDAGGNRIWQHTFGEGYENIGYSVQQTSDGGYVIAGFTGGYPAPEDVYLIKTDAGGNQIWQRTFGGSSWDEGRSIQQTADGGYIVAGTTYSYGAGLGDVYLVKTDASGNQIW